jgi:Leucine-rich repeat (LRR) protein
VSYNCIDDQGISIISKALPPTLESLTLRSNLLSPASHIHLLPLFTSLKSLDLSENQLTDAFFRSLFLELAMTDNIVTFNNLEVLKLEICGLTDVSVMAI